MRTQTCALSLLVFATAFLCCCALPGNGRDDGHRDSRQGLVRSNEPHRESLQKRKPPANVPGPKLTPEEQIATFFPGLYTHEEKPKKHLTDTDRGKKKDMAPMNEEREGRNCGPEGKHKPDRKEKKPKEERLD